MATTAPNDTLNQAPFNMMEGLPPKLMTNILEFSSLPEKITVAGTCKILRKKVNKECPKLWTTLDFSAASSSARSMLTDKGLAGLLKRVNAKNVTKSINLAFCIIDGSGLSPLRHSPVLEFIDLRSDNPDFHETRRVVRELRTMIHHKLSHVRFNHSSCEAVTNFLRDLSAAKLKQAIEQNLKCNACGEAVADESRQLVPNITGVPPFQCNECKNCFCLGADCPVKVDICASCAGTKCAGCDDSNNNKCNACLVSFCKDCADLTLGECVGCKEVSCDSCRSFCATCDNTFCSYCVQVEGSIFPCFCCNKEYCFQCREVSMCDDCKTFLCNKCLEVKRCAYCQGNFCVKCRDVTSMPNEYLEVVDEEEVFHCGTVDVCAKCQDKMAELL